MTIKKINELDGWVTVENITFANEGGVVMRIASVFVLAMAGAGLYVCCGALPGGNR